MATPYTTLIADTPDGLALRKKFAAAFRDDPSAPLRLEHDLRDQDIPPGQVRSAVAMVRKLAKRLNGHDHENAFKGMVIPAPYACDEDGVRKQIISDDQPRDIVLTRTPVLVKRRMVDGHDGSERLRVVWYDRNKWRYLDVPRATLAQARLLPQLADKGFPATSSNAGELVSYLQSLYEVNDLPIEDTTSRLGWVGDQWVQSDQSTNIRVVIDDDGLDHIARSTRAAGSYEDFQQAIQIAGDHPAVMLGIYASLASCALDPLGLPGFCLSWDHTTSTGKTTALRLAAAVWGCADEMEPHSLIHSWDSTRVYRERLAMVLGNIPIFLDDTQRAKNRAEVEQTLYDLTQGRGRGRGSVRGVQHTGTWRSVLLSTGESPITEYGQAGGARARVLSLWGSPWGGHCPDVGRITQLVIANYGHLGPDFASRLCNADRLADLRGWVDHRKQQAAWTSEVAGRVGGHGALLYGIARACREWLPWWPQHDLDAMWNDLLRLATKAERDADRAAVAAEHIRGWLASNAHALDNNGNDKPPSGGWIGVRDTAGCRNMVIPSKLLDELGRAGYDPQAILSAWVERGLIPRGGEGDRHGQRYSWAGKGRPRLLELADSHWS